ncbi:hypothetical protein BOW44_13235, partial [Solemya velum gill symbiont]
MEGQYLTEDELTSVLQDLPPMEGLDLEAFLERARGVTDEELEELTRAQGGPENSFISNDEIEALTSACEEDGPWYDEDMTGRGPIEPPNSPIPASPEAGPSHETEPRGTSDDIYTLRLRGQRTFAKTAAKERTYRVLMNENLGGRRLIDIRKDLHRMFDDVIRQARDDLADNDLGRVVIHHPGLQNPIVVSLRRLELLNAESVMSTIEKVLQSHETLAVDTGFEIDVGVIRLPKGAGGPRRRITDIHGKKNSLNLKRSIITIENDDQLCMARAIAVTWAKSNLCTKEEWDTITATRGSKSNLELILEHRRVPESHYKHLCEKSRKTQKDLAVAFCRLAGVPLDRPSSLGDLPAFEDALGVRILVVSARLGNKFLTCAETDHPERPCVYLYLVDDDH